MSVRKPQRSLGRPISINNLEGYLRINNTVIKVQMLPNLDVIKFTNTKYADRESRQNKILFIIYFLAQRSNTGH